MRYSTIISLAALAGPALAYPRGRRQDSAAASSADVTVLRFAEALQHLESEFYKQAMAKFSAKEITDAGYASSELVLEQWNGIVKDEETHSTVLSDVITQLGAKPVEGCKLDFGAALDSVTSVAATARVVENVGVSAFLGAAHLIEDPSILTAAATILTVEARHQTVLNIFSGSGHAIPNAFDMGLKPNEVLAIAGGFVSGCDLGVGPALPALAITAGGTIGSKLEFSGAELNATSSCHILAGGMAFSYVQPADNCMVPEALNLNGPMAVFITSDDQPLANNPRDRASNKVVAGPALVFVDPNAQAVPALVRKIDGVKLQSDAAASNTDASNTDASKSETSVSSGNAGTSVSSGNSGNSAESSGESKAAPVDASSKGGAQLVNDKMGKWGTVKASA